MRRHIGAVIDQVVVELPAGEFGELRGSLAQLKQDSVYKAPEMMREMWEQFCSLLDEHLSDPEAADSPEYMSRIKTIMLGEE